MKKIITLCFFAFAMVLGTQSAAAQTMVEVNAIAAKKTKELKQAVKFNTDTEHAVYETLQAYVSKKFSLDKIVSEGGTVSSEDKVTIDNMVAEKFKNLFTEEQFQRYLEFEKANN
ncbi:MAG: hypothetical protein ACSHXF_00135 [Aquaticitalea sp.]